MECNETGPETTAATEANALPATPCPKSNAAAERPCPKTPATALFGEDGWRYLAEKHHLSGREVQIAQAIVEDRKETAVAEALGLSPHTIHTYVERLYRKLEVVSRVELVVRLTQHFLEASARLDGALPPVCEVYHTGQCQHLSEE